MKEIVEAVRVLVEAVPRESIIHATQGARTTTDFREKNFNMEIDVFAMLCIV